MPDDWRISMATYQLKRGGIIAYPTEAVYGLGCNPLDDHALQRLIEIKGRSAKKGFILIAADWSQLEPFVRPAEGKSTAAISMAEIQATWPGPNTWVLPAQPGLPPELTGDRQSIAVRVTGHPLAARLCHAFGGPIVSTSANFSNQAPARSILEIQLKFSRKIDYLLSGTLGGDGKPSVIRDGITGQQLR